MNRYDDFDYEIIDNIVIVKILSDLSPFSRQGFEDFLEEMVIEKVSLVFDLTEVNYLNSDCLGLLVRKSKRTKAVIVNPKSCLVKDVLDIVNIDKIIPVFKDIQEAFKFLGANYGS